MLKTSFTVLVYVVLICLFVYMWYKTYYIRKNKWRRQLLRLVKKYLFVKDYNCPINKDEEFTIFLIKKKMSEMFLADVDIDWIENMWTQFHNESIGQVCEEKQKHMKIFNRKIMNIFKKMRIEINKLR